MWILHEHHTAFIFKYLIPVSYTSHTASWLFLSFPQTSLFHLICGSLTWPLTQIFCKYISAFFYFKKVTIGTDFQCKIPFAISASISWASAGCSGSSGCGPGGTVVVTPGAGVVVVVVVVGGGTSVILLQNHLITFDILNFTEMIFTTA